MQNFFLFLVDCVMHLPQQSLQFRMNFNHLRMDLGCWQQIYGPPYSFQSRSCTFVAHTGIFSKTHSDNFLQLLWDVAKPSQLCQFHWRYFSTMQESGKMHLCKCYYRVGNCQDTQWHLSQWEYLVMMLSNNGTWPDCSPKQDNHISPISDPYYYQCKSFCLSMQLQTLWLLTPYAYRVT